VNIFVTGGTGYLGSRLIPLLAGRGHRVLALVRPGSESRLPDDCRAVIGDALDQDTYAGAATGADCLVHLTGVTRPTPGKARQFVEVDLGSVRAAVAVALQGDVRHFVYVSVAQPAPVMRAYVAVRRRCEELLQASGLDATIFRPWYVLGPGHRWPYVLLPAYWIARRLPATRDAAERLGLVTLREMLAGLIQAIEHPARGVCIIDVPGIRSLGAGASVP
jgi:uncharacterized protein YbjT (DUF2867 family)